MKRLIFSLVCLGLLAQALYAAPVYQKCEDIVFGRRSDDALAGLLAGEKLFGEIPDDFEIDKQTATDLHLDKVAAVFDQYFYSDFGRARFRYMLAHPHLDADEIRRRQANLKFVIENPEKFNEIRDQLALMKRKREGFLKEFASLEKEENGIRNEWYRASLTYTLLAAPALAHFLPIDVGNWIQWLLAGRGGSLGYSNAINNVEPKRNSLKRYRDEMLAAKHLADATDHFEDGKIDELKAAINVLYEGKKDSFKDKNWVKLNSVFNKADRDLVIETGIDPTLPIKPSDQKGLLELNRKLRLMEKKWTIRIPWTQKIMPVANPNTIIDKLHWTNFSLIRLQSEVVEAKKELSVVFSAMAEMEVLIAMADFYQANKDKMPLEFFEILDIDEPTELTAEDAHHPMIATDKDLKSVGNDIKLDSKGFTVIFSQMGGGASTYQETAALCQIFAQNGWFSFAKKGRITPGLLMTALDLRPNLGPDQVFRHVEAKRHAAILRLHEHYPHSFTYIHNPFTDGGETAGVALRVAELMELIQLKTSGIMSTRSRPLLEQIKNDPELHKIFIEQRVVREFNYTTDTKDLLPDVYYKELQEDGLPARLTAMAHDEYQKLAKKIFTNGSSGN